MDGRAIRSLVNHPALDYDELRFDYGDVVLAAIGWGEWQSLERSLAEGLRALGCRRNARAGRGRGAPRCDWLSAGLAA